MKKSEAKIGMRVLHVDKPILDSSKIKPRSNRNATICGIPDYGVDRGYILCQLANGSIERWCLNRIQIISQEISS